MRTLILFAMILLSSARAEGGWLIVEQKSDRFGNFGMQSTIISGQKVRIEHQTSTFIFELDSNLTTVVLPKQQIFWRGHHDSLGEALHRQLELQIGLMIAQLPEKEREKAAEEMRFLTGLMRSHRPDSLLPDHFRIQATDSSTTILNYKCRKYLLRVDSVTVEEIWVTNDVKPWAGINLRQLNQMMRLFSKPSLYSAYRVSDEWLGMLGEGLLMRSVAVNTLGNSVMEVSAVKQMNIKGEVFLPPAEYRRAGLDEILTVFMSGQDAIKPNTGEPEAPKLPARPKPSGTRPALPTPGPLF